MAERISDKESIRRILLFEFLIPHTSAEAYRNLCSAFGREVLSERQCRRWFEKFQSGRYDIEDEPGRGRPLEVDLKKLVQLVTDNPRQSSYELGKQLDCDHSQVVSHLHELGYVSKLGSWVPHELTEANIGLQQRVSICSSLLSRYPQEEFLRSIITGDEKWVLYIMHSRKRQWVPRGAQPEPEPKGDVHERKQMLSVFWDLQGIIHWELLAANTTVNANLYCTQLDRLRQSIQKKRPRWAQERGKVRLLVDNARPHTAKITREKLEKFRWEVLPHPAYSPDLAPSDYALFRSLSNKLREKRFDDRKDLEIFLQNFFDHKSERFYSDAIMFLPQRWESVLDTDGAYLV